MGGGKKEKEGRGWAGGEGRRRWGRGFLKTFENWSQRGVQETAAEGQCGHLRATPQSG